MGVLVVILAVAAAYLALSGGARPSASSTSETTVLDFSQTLSIVNGSVTVNASGYEYYKFSVPSRANIVIVQGSFTVSGNSTLTIDVSVMNSTAFSDLEAGRPVSAYYDSGRLHASTFNVNLPVDQGTYYLVYSNTFSTLYSKNVITQAIVTYNL
jgi:hypothetical protein